MSKKPIRSPSYPSLPLSDAVDAVRKIEAEYVGSAVEREIAAKLIGYSSLSGPANKALAALASFGLVERAGKGMMKVTGRARAILHPASEEEKTQNLRAAALEPRLFQDIRDRFPDIAIPPEEGVISYLRREEFNPSAVRPAAKAFLETMEFVESLQESDSHGFVADAAAQLDSPDDETTFGGASVGDLVQWERQGVPQFETPRRVRWVSPDADWLAVEDSDTGIPMSQVTVERSGAKEPPPIPPAQPRAQAEAPPTAGQRKAVFPVSEGDVTFLFPDGMTEDGIEELEAYLAVFLKKEKRKVAEN